MIIYIPHKEIDKVRWDRCIARSINAIVYADSWYLDLVSPEWDALVEDDYISVFPLTHKRKFGIRYLAQPFFTQQLGLFTSGILSQELVTRFLEAIPPKFKLAEISLNSFNKVDPGIFQVTPRINLELELIHSYEELNRNYSQNTRRNLRKALDAGVNIHKKIAADDLVALFRSNFGGKEGKLGYKDYMTILNVINRSMEKACGTLLGAGAMENRLDAAAFFLRDNRRFIMLMGATDFTTRGNGAMFLLLDTFIREHAGEPFLLDFEGGNDPNLGRFYRSFGSRETLYSFVRISRIPKFFTFA